ncbi:hypothetical protein Poli38472_008447 [Pythium oligandrum]|uniref:BED-type domain-containing protein n=1 Tax=Pythium oligandrum TaxID=41045 RepID=A0A8K1FCG2_PYTOL|nr:hypothetical protein Poli38472_008447 [Pythium oligandrum]|eukprot:TMW55799.1 hypothetical protein Poli38472_008447 [Pythium oligandrum]
MSNGVAHGELTLFDCPRIRKSEYWQFIKLVAPTATTTLPEGQTHWVSQDATDAFCLRCNKMFRFVKGSSNSVRRHMERFHRKELLKRQAQQANEEKRATVSYNKRNTTRKAKRQSSPEQETAAEENRSSPAPIHEVPAAMPAKKQRLESLYALDQRHSIELMLKWMATSLRPLRMVLEPGFGAFVAHISGTDPSFSPPAVEALHHHLELMRENTRFEVKQRIKKEVSSFVLSLEPWRSPRDYADVPAFVEMHCWYLNEDFVRQSCVLDVVPMFKEAEDELRTKLHSVIQEFGLQKHLATSCLVPATDEELGNIIQTVDFQQVNEVRSMLDGVVACSVHWLQGTAFPDPRAERISGSLETGLGIVEGRQVFGEALSDVIHSVEWIRSSRLAFNKLCEAHTVFAGELKKLPSVSPSQWSFAVLHDFFARVILIRASIDSIASDETFTQVPKKPNTLSWFLAEGLVLLWRPLQEVLQVVDNEKVCSTAFIIPILSMVKQHFTRVDLFDDLQQRYLGILADSDVASSVARLQLLRVHIQNWLAKCYPTLLSPDHAWISALDPRYARLRHLSEEEREACKCSLVEQAVELHLSHVPHATETLSSLTGDLDGDLMGGDSRPGLMHRLLYEEEEEVVAPPPSADVMSARDAELAQTRLYVANEVVMYLNEHQVRKTRILCPLQWWSANRERYPFLSPLARLWLGTVACLTSPLDRELPSELAGDPSADAASWTKSTADFLYMHAHLRGAHMDTTVAL